MPNQITAPEIDNWLFQCGADRNPGHQPLPLTPESLAVLTEIGNTLETVIPTKSDAFDRRWEWVSTAPCGTEQAYVDARKDSFCDDYTEQDARENFRWEYPRPVKTYRMTYIRTAVRGEPYDALFMNSDFVAETHNPQTEACRPTDMRPLLSLVLAGAKEAAGRAMAGTYQTWIDAAVPKEERYGLISRHTLRNLVPALRQRFYEGTSDGDVREFLSLKDRILAGDPMAPYLPSMTQRQYLHAAALCLQASGCGPRDRYAHAAAERDGLRLTDDMVLYLSHADGRDDGLCRLPENDPDAFRDFCGRKGKYRNSFGGHPWEIRTSMSIEHSMHLYPARKDGSGWYFAVSGKAYTSSAEAMQYVLALRRAGLPVILMDAETIVPRFTEEDDAAVCPETDTLWYGVPERVRPYANDGITLADDIILGSGKKEDVMRAVRWLPEPDLVPAEGAGNA